MGQEAARRQNKLSLSLRVAKLHPWPKRAVLKRKHDLLVRESSAFKRKRGIVYHDCELSVLGHICLRIVSRHAPESFLLLM
jgi:hypothetical protein